MLLSYLHSDDRTSRRPFWLTMENAMVGYDGGIVAWLSCAQPRGRYISVQCTLAGLLAARWSHALSLYNKWKP